MHEIYGGVDLYEGEELLIFHTLAKVSLIIFRDKMSNKNLLPHKVRYLGEGGFLMIFFNSLILPFIG